MYQFISGYNSQDRRKLRQELLNEKPTISACFGAPFFPLHPGKYAHMLGDKMQEETQRSMSWMINTGWTGGPYGTGTRNET
jgi:phosphoenolpyruvate carboxykinase (ATP)